MEPDRVSLTIKNLPRRIHRRLQARAIESHRSLNSEVIACLKAAVTAERVAPEELLVRARALRAGVRGPIADRELTRLKRQGRP